IAGMEEDDYSCGQPKNNKVYGDAMAILAGDALLTHAFELLSSPPLTAHFPAVLLQQVSYRVARAAGSFGMIGGQVMDIVSEGKQVPLEVLEYIHRHKTAALLTASVIVGGLLGGGTPEQVQALERYGHDVGWAYQIADDLLDVEGDAATIGKQVGRDAVLEKVTYPALLGIEPSRQRATELMEQGIAALTDFGPRAERLRQIAAYIVSRNVYHAQPRVSRYAGLAARPVPQ